MQYQVLVENSQQNSFIASVIGMPSLAMKGRTEAEAIAKLKTALEMQLARGKIVTIDLDVKNKLETATSELNYAGVWQEDPSFDDFMTKLAEIRREANEITEE